MLVGPRITPPTGLTSRVDGRTVRVEWTPSQESALRTGFVVEAGSGPGLADLVPYRLDGDQTSVVVTDVPPGRYFVRVRAANGSGAGLPSVETVITGF
jgi:hypothetical protein